MGRFIEIVYDNSGSMDQEIQLNGRSIKKYEYAHQVFKDTILPELNINSNDRITLRKLRDGCNGLSHAITLPNNGNEILNFLKSIQHNNGTPLYFTIKDSFDSFYNNNSDGLIIIITDGLDTCKINITDVLPEDLVNQINMGVTVVLVPFAIADRVTLEKLETIGRTIKARTTPIGDNKNQDSTKYGEEFKRAINSKKEETKSENVNEIHNKKDAQPEKLSYPLIHCYGYDKDGEIDWDTLELLDFSFHNALRLFHEDLLSWEPKRNKTINNTQIEELNFLYGLVFKTGLPLNLVKTMLAQLKKPYYYNNKCIYWDFSDACWKYFKDVVPVKLEMIENKEKNNTVIIEKVYQVIKNDDDTIELKHKARGKNIMQHRKYVNIGDYIEFKQKGKRK
jgi:hypothetical protein